MLNKILDKIVALFFPDADERRDNGGRNLREEFYARFPPPGSGPTRVITMREVRERLDRVVALGKLRREEDAALPQSKSE